MNHSLDLLTKTTWLEIIKDSGIWNIKKIWNFWNIKKIEMAETTFAKRNHSFPREYILFLAHETVVLTGRH